MRCPSLLRLLLPLLLAFAPLLVWAQPAAPAPASAAAKPPPPSAIPAALGALHARVSHDGQWIACIYQGLLCRMPAAGGPLTALAPGAGADSHPAWSPDNKTIAYALGTVIRLIDATTGALIPLPKAATGRGPFWFSNDGKKILGRFATAPTTSPVAWLDLATGAIEPVVGLPESHAARLRGVYAPTADGKSVLFVEHFDKENEQGGNNGPEADVWRVPVTGGQAEKICRWPARIYGLFPDPRGDAVYAVTDGGLAYNDIWHLPLTNTIAHARKITWGQADEDSPSLAATGDVLYYTDNRSGCTTIMRQKLASNETDIVAATAIDFHSPATQVRVIVTDEKGAPTSARLSMKHKGNGCFHAPPGAMHRRINNTGWFYLTGEASFALPEGDYEIRAARGPEYKILLNEQKVAGVEATIEIKLERWVNMAERGWFSGENHIHANYGYGEWHNTPPSILQMCEGEDLNVANMVLANSDGNGVFDRQFFRGALDPLSKPHTLLWWNEEFRSTIWGHMTLFHLKQVVEPVYTGFPNTTNPWDIPTNGDIARRTHWQNAVASYTHPTNNPIDFYDQPYSAKGLPIDAALGLIDVVDVMGYVYEPSVPLWYRLLNCGFRIPAAAGTDVFLNRINSYPPGHGRVYVHVDGAFTYESWIDGLKKGRSFVSNSPMLEFTVDGNEPGATIHLDQPGKVKVVGKVSSAYPVEKLVVMQNGISAGDGVLEPGGLSGKIEAEIQVDRTGWIALRASGPANDGSMARSMAAHTNPVYVEVKGTRPITQPDAEFFLGWIDRLEADLKRRNRVPESEMKAVLDHLNQARSVYQKLRQTAP